MTENGLHFVPDAALATLSPASPGTSTTADTAALTKQQY